MKPIVFFVDDEPMNLTVFEAALPAEWDVRCFHSPKIALEELKTVEPAVVISDQRMPQMKGVDFLAAVQLIHPETVRMVVTGYSDEQLIIESVRKARVFDYVRKPWDPDDLVDRIGNAIKHYHARKGELARLSRSDESAIRNKSSSQFAIGLPIDGSFILDAETQTLTLSADFCGLLAIDPAHTTMPRALLWQSVIAADRSVLDEAIRMALQSNATQRPLVQFMHADGRTLTLAIALKRLTGSGSDLPQISAIVLDMTEHKLREKRMLEHANSVDRTNHQLDEFASVLAHDLAEPIRNANGYLSLLGRHSSSLDSEQRQLLESAINCGKNAQSLVIGLLRFSRMASIDAEEDTICLTTAAKQAVKNLETQLQHQSVAVEFSDLPEVWGSMPLLVQVLQTVVASALQNAGESPIQIKIAAKESGGTTVVSIADTGPSPTPEQLRDMFHLAGQGRSSRQQVDHVGMAICKHLLERQGGSIVARANPAGGTLIELTVRSAKMNSNAKRQVA